VVQPPGIKLQQRKLPLARNDFRGERFSAPLHSDEQYAFRRIEIHRSRFARETDARAIEPRFQLRKSAELERVLLDRKKLEDAAFGDDLALALDDRADVVGAQRAVA